MANINQNNILKDKIKELYEAEINNIINIINLEYIKKTQNTNLFNIINTKEIVYNWKTKIDINLDAFNFIKEYDNKKKRPINPINYCYARKPNLKRCTRNKKNNSDYCASHQFNLLYGRIDQEFDENIKKNLHKQKSLKTSTSSTSSTSSKTSKEVNLQKQKELKELKEQKQKEKELKEQQRKEIKELKEKKKKNKQIILNKIKIDDDYYLIDKENFVYISEIIDNKTKYRNIGIFNKITNKIENMINKDI
jgi:hypothetical protein